MSATIETFRAGIAEKLITAFLLDPRVKRGLVWCRVCGAGHRVDPEKALRAGWPKCCGQTMTIDSPEERVNAET